MKRASWTQRVESRVSNKLRKLQKSRSPYVIQSWEAPMPTGEWWSVAHKIKAFIVESIKKRKGALALLHGEALLDLEATDTRRVSVDMLFNEPGYDLAAQLEDSTLVVWEDPGVMTKVDDLRGELIGEVFKDEWGIPRNQLHVFDPGCVPEELAYNQEAMYSSQMETWVSGALTCLWLIPIITCPSLDPENEEEHNGIEGFQIHIPILNGNTMGGFPVFNYAGSSAWGEEVEAEDHSWVVALPQFLQSKAKVEVGEPRRIASGRRGESSSPEREPQAVRVIGLRKFERQPHTGQERESNPVDWSCRWEVRSHWSTLKDGRCVPVKGHIKGPEDKPIKKPEIIYKMVR